MFTLPALLQPLCTQFGCTVAVAVAIVILAAADFYIVVSKDVVTVAVALEMHACVGRDQHLCCFLFPPWHQHVCAFIYNCTRLNSKDDWSHSSQL